METTSDFAPSKEQVLENLEDSHSNVKKSWATASDKKSKAGQTDISSDKSVNLVEESVFTMLTAFRFE